MEMKLRAIIAILSASLLTLVFALVSGAGPPACVIDADGDGVLDCPGPTSDNCIELGKSNPGQRDDDGDGFGNLCDYDVNQDCSVGGGDLGAVFNSFGISGPAWGGNVANARLDVNEDNSVGGSDLGAVFNSFGVNLATSGNLVSSRSCKDCLANTAVCP